VYCLIDFSGTKGRLSTVAVSLLDARSFVAYGVPTLRKYAFEINNWQKGDVDTHLRRRALSTGKYNVASTIRLTAYTLSFAHGELEKIIRHSQACGSHYELIDVSQAAFSRTRT
jgi:hypothetical protein